jgi:hypothetical protein
MRSRSITDREISIIKAMLTRGMRNRDIQFYFNRQDRPVNSGRITGIKSGTYGPEVPAADDATLDDYLEEFTPGEVGVTLVRERAANKRPTLAELAQGRFSQSKVGHWVLTEGETADQECKEACDPKKLSPIIRAVAGLANNKGGFLFVGVKNDGLEVVGMADKSFTEMDVATLTNKLKHHVTPTPSFTKFDIDVGGHRVGVVAVDQHRHRPVVVCRDGEGLEDGSILFRYPGQTSRIKFGDLFSLLNDRDKAVRQELLSSASRLSEIGPEKALILDTASGTIDVGQNTVVIDEDLANRLEFIREGEFQEKDGAPTLRLIGDVQPVKFDGKVVERVELRALTPEMVLRAYLRRESVKGPLEYVKLSALIQRQWLPLFYFVWLSGGGNDAAIAMLKKTQAAYTPSKQSALDRLQGKKSAYVPLSGLALPVGEELKAGKIDGILDRHSPVLVGRAIQGMEDDTADFAALLKILDAMHEAASANSVLRGAVYRAASRLDELEDQARQRKK